jgi:hypothetical protein
MTVEYLVLGVVIVLLGVGQTYLRHFAGGKDPEAAAERRQVPTRSGRPAGRVGQTWGSISGMVGIALGVVLIVLGILGR